MGAPGRSGHQGGGRAVTSSGPEGPPKRVCGVMRQFRASHMQVRGRGGGLWVGMGPGPSPALALPLVMLGPHPTPSALVMATLPAPVCAGQACPGCPTGRELVSGSAAASSAVTLGAQGLSYPRLPWSPVALSSQTLWLCFWSGVRVKFRLAYPVELDGGASCSTTLGSHMVRAPHRPLSHSAQLLLGGRRGAGHGRPGHGEAAAGWAWRVDR